MSARNPFGRAILVAGLLAFAATAAFPGTAEAGCLTEQRSCRDCASRQLKKAIFRLDGFGILDANVALWDCDIDLYHCVFLGQHHQTACAV